MTNREQIEIQLHGEEMLFLMGLRDQQPRIASLDIEWSRDEIKSDMVTIENLRGVLTEVLATVGFDEHYNPTLAGKMIESIIDKLFVPNSKLC